MTTNDLVKNHHQTFESIKKISENGNEFWLARELQPLLEYTSWDKFKRVIEKAKESCQRSGQIEANHFSHLGKMVDIDTGSIENQPRAQDKVLDFTTKRSYTL